jgi:trehalose-6-phosphatase
VDQGDAVRWIIEDVEAPGATTSMVFFGDDVTDETHFVRFVTA